MEDSELAYNLINSLITIEDDDALDELPDDADAITDDDEDNLICEVNLNADNCRLCKAKAIHDAVLGKTDASPVKKTLTALEWPHSDTKSLIAKLDDVAQTVDLDVSTILAEQIKYPILGLYNHGYVEESYPKQYHLKFNNPKDCFDITKSLTDFWLKKKDNYYAITSLPTNWRMRTYEFADSYHFF